MEVEAGGPCSRKRKSAGLDALLDAVAAVEGRGPEATAEDQEPPLDAAEGGGAGDRISGLPDGVLGEIVSLLPTREGARTQILASRWRHLWRSAPLNLDHHWICDDEGDLDAVVSRVLTAHPGPGRRFCAPVYHLRGDRAAIADAWLRSPALDNLQELELCSYEYRLPCTPATLQPLPAAAFRFSETLCVATIGECHIPDSTAQALRFPKLQTLALKKVSISECSLHAMITACPALEGLLICRSSGFRCVRINSIGLRSIGVGGSGFLGGSGFPRELRFEELIIENAPCLESLLQLETSDGLQHISLISAPKLETIRLSSDCSATLAFDSTIIQGSRVHSLTTTVRTVKILSIDMRALSLDAVIDLIRCFPCLEKLYIESIGPGKTNLWRRKHRNLIRSLDIRLKTVALRYYRGIKSHVDFATFFLLNARMLELMTLQVYLKDYNDEFFAQQSKMLQLDMKASEGACLHFTPVASHRCSMDLGIHDLDLADPFKWRYP